MLTVGFTRHREVDSNPIQLEQTGIYFQMQVVSTCRKRSGGHQGGAGSTAVRWWSWLHLCIYSTVQNMHRCKENQYT